MYIVALREIRAEVAAAALLAPQRGARDQPPDGDAGSTVRQSLRIERGRRRDGRVQRLPGRVERPQRTRQPVAIPEQADVAATSVATARIGSATSAAEPRRLRGSPQTVDGAGSTGALSSVAHRASRARAEDQSLEQRVAGEPVGAVDARAGDLAGGEQPRDRRAAVEIGLTPPMT